jgi:hypothetical protein
MKRKVLSSIVLFLISVYFAFFAVKTSRADWYWIHGHSGNPAEASTVQADGLQAAVSFTSVWVHYAVPTVGESSHKVRYIKLRYTLSNYAGQTNISAVHIYNGETKIKEFNSGWPPVVYSGPQLHEVTFDLGSATVCDRGLGVSVQISSDMNGGAETLVIHSVGANFESPASADSAGFYVIPVSRTP